MRWMLLLIVALSTVMLSSCGGGGETIDLTVYERDLGTVKNVKAGHWISVELDENPTTGFTWHREWAPEGLVALTQDYYVPDQPVVAGSGGTRHYVFEAQAPGQAVITFQYGQWWDGGTQMEPKTLTLNITE